MKLINVLLAVAVFLGIAFGLMEGGLRLIGFAPPPINTEFDPDLGWRGVPGSSIDNESDEFDVRIELDDLGLRDDFRGDEAIARALEPTRFRVLFLGDSFVGGYTVDREHLFVDMLERAYAKEGRPVEIVNAGLQGYSTDQQLLWLRANGERFRPDLVVLFPYENDIWWNGRGDYVGEPKPHFDATGARVAKELVAPPARTWFGRTALGSLGRLFEGGVPTVDVDGRAVLVEESSRLVAPPPETLAAEAVTARLVAEVGRAAEALGAKFVVAPIPTKDHVARLVAGTAGNDGPVDPTRPYRLFADAARAAGAELIDLQEDLKSAATGDSPYYDRDFHLAPRGNAVVAGTLYDAFDSLALVPHRPEGGGASARPSSDRFETPSRFPRWPLWYLGLVLALGTLYARTYPDEPKAEAYLKVGLLLATVFGIALGGGAILGALPPLVARITLAAVLIALFTFIAYKLGDRIGTIAELMRCFTLRGHWYLIPLLSVLLTVGSLLVVAASSPLVAPFIYTLF